MACATSSAKEARQVARWARAAKLKSRTLRWQGPPPVSDIEAAAREARYRLMGEWVRAEKLAALYVAHTRDDQAETFLLRLMRGSGLDGLSAMRPIASFPLPEFRDLAVVRPLLALERDAVRAHLAANKLAWLDDPMNQEDRFARVRLRKLVPALEAAGLSRARIAAAAGHIARARDALDTVTAAVLERAVRPAGGSFHIDSKALAAAPREIGLRALARLLMVVSENTYRPRFERLERLFDLLCDNRIGGGATLHGCRIYLVPGKGGAFGAGTVVIARESGRSGAKKSKRAPAA